MRISMVKPIPLLIFSFFVTHICGQRVYEHYDQLTDSLRIGNNKTDIIPYSEKGFTLIMPDKSEPLQGILISLEDGKYTLKDKTEKQLIHPAANQKGFAVLYVSTGVPLDLYFNNASLLQVDYLLKKVFADYALPNKNIFFFGSMVSGHRVLKYIEYCKKGNSLFNPDIKGVVVSESAIDWVRMWYEAQKQVRDHISEVQLFEGNLITYLFQANFHQTPETAIEKYLEFSAYSYFDTKMRNIKYFKDLAVRAYTFAPINYWFSASGKGVNDSNYPDMSGFINELKIAGDKKAELVVFTNETRAKADKMETQSNTWNLIDKKELMDWIASQTGK
ncbi:MAG TPA: hypothetical protein VKR53_19210 [Puia sp.]|nr:hypothetical protein [Puia sp.]